MLASEKWKDGDVHPNTANNDSKSRLREKKKDGKSELQAPKQNKVFKKLTVKSTLAVENGLEQNSVISVTLAGLNT